MTAQGGEFAKGLSRAPRREDYEPIVKGLRPFIHGEELEVRSSLLLFRDRAMATKATACEPEWYLLDVVERVSSENAMNYSVSLEDLREMRRLCANIVCAASGFRAMFQPRLPLGDGEADARG